jgi:Putative peptidoglycan binding domain
MRSILLAGLVSVGLLAIGADSAFARGYFSVGNPGGVPALSGYPLAHTPSNQAWERNNAWAAYNANLGHIPTAENPNRLAPRQNLLDQDRFIQMPQSSRRYNFQFSDNEIRSVQAALRQLGIYSGQVDGILGPETRGAIEDYQVKNKLPVTGQPDRGLNALLGIS